MNRRRRPPPLALAALLAALPAASSPAGDWPQWRGPGRTGHVPAGEPVPAALPAAPKVVWNVPVGFGLASPVVAGGRVFHIDNQGEKEVVHAVDAASGKTLWSTPLDEAFKDSQSASGPRCTPVVDGDRVYAQSCRGELKCLSAADGKEIWRASYTADFGATFTGEKGKAEGATRHGNTGSPVVDGDRLIAQVGGANGAGLVCFDKASGKVRWTSVDDAPAYAAPFVGDVAGVRQLLVFTTTALVGCDAQGGKVLWRVPVKTALGRHVTTPIVAGDLVLVSSHQAGLLAVRVTREGDAFKAEQAWANKDAAINFSSPVAVGGHLYGVGPRQNLVCVEIATGTIAWSKDGFFSSQGSKAHAGIIAAGPNLLVLTDNGQLVMVAADPKEYREVGRAQACGTNWCNPAYADGKLFVRDGRELRCVQLN